MVGHRCLALIKVAYPFILHEAFGIQEPIPGKNANWRKLWPKAQGKVLPDGFFSHFLLRGDFPKKGGPLFKGFYKFF